MSRALFEYIEKISDKSEKELFNATRNLYPGSHFSKETHHSSFDRSRYSGMKNIKNIKIYMRCIYSLFFYLFQLVFSPCAFYAYQYYRYNRKKFSYQFSYFTLMNFSHDFQLRQYDVIISFKISIKEMLI